MKIENLNKTLSLENDGELSFFFVGVGSAFAKAHFQNNILVIKGSDHLLIDCGTLCPYALWNYGVNSTSIKNLLITWSRHNLKRAPSSKTDELIEMGAMTNNITILITRSTKDNSASPSIRKTAIEPKKPRKKLILLSLK